MSTPILPVVGTASVGDEASASAPLLSVSAPLRVVRRDSTIVAYTSRIVRRAILQTSPVPNDRPVAVRESVAEHLERRRSRWSISKPALVLNALWNAGIAVAISAILWSSCDEQPSRPLRLWALGFVLVCVLHVITVVLDYRRRPRVVATESGGANTGSDDELEDKSCIAKMLESGTSLFYAVWWILGVYWVYSGGQTLAHGAPQLYWLTVAALALDFSLLVLGFALACLIAIAVCCCLPCIIVLLQSMADQEGAYEDDIQQIPKFKFYVDGEKDKLVPGAAAPAGGIMRSLDANPPVEHILQLEDAACCICLCLYENGVELRKLQCGHHFHSACVDKWLHINAICPLCKSSILRTEQV